MAKTVSLHKQPWVLVLSSQCDLLTRRLKICSLLEIKECIQNFASLAPLLHSQRKKISLVTWVGFQPESASCPEFWFHNPLPTLMMWEAFPYSCKYWSPTADGMRQERWNMKIFHYLFQTQAWKLKGFYIVQPPIFRHEKDMIHDTNYLCDNMNMWTYCSSPFPPSVLP